MRANREKLLPWLIQKIESGVVPGLHWINKEKTDFRITWKHAGKPDFDLDNDAVLFRMWAEHTGKYKPGEQPDPSTWKTRFRCALRKQPDIDEVPVANSLDENDPYRVFRLKNRANRLSPSHNAPLTPPSDDIMEVSSYHANILPDMPPGYNHEFSFPSPDGSYGSSSDDSDDIDSINPTITPFFYINSEFDGESYSQTFSEERNDYFDHMDMDPLPIHDGIEPMMSPQTADPNTLQEHDLAALIAVFGPTFSEILTQPRPAVYGSPFTDVCRELQTYAAMALNFSA